MSKDKIKELVTATHNGNNTIKNTKIYIATTIVLHGMEYHRVNIEVEISTGLPRFIIVGLPDAIVSESRTRILNLINRLVPTGTKALNQAITVNLSPAHLKKIGSHYDLPITVCLLTALKQLPEQALDFVYFGELTLNGMILSCKGVLVAAMYAKAHNQQLICATDHIQHVKILADALAFETIFELMQYFTTNKNTNNINNLSHSDLNKLHIESQAVKQTINHINGSKALNPTHESPKNILELDLQDVKGQENAKFALEIAAAGGHHILLKGPAGCGKSMLAKRLVGLLPDLTSEYALECTILHSLHGAHSIITRPVFREPHHGASVAALVGGGSQALPGEVSLAHAGVLFLDEFAEFSRAALQSLREVLETGKVTIARAQAHYTYPAKFLAIAAMNDCKCGMNPCKAGVNCARNYWQKISGPLIDRFDLCVQVESIKPWELQGLNAGKNSKIIRENVSKARELQINRQNCLNSDLGLDQLDQYLDDKTRSTLYHITRKIKLSGRGMIKVLRVARTIADLELAKHITTEHIMAACGYRLVMDAQSG